MFDNLLTYYWCSSRVLNKVERYFFFLGFLRFKSFQWSHFSQRYPVIVKSDVATRFIGAPHLRQSVSGLFMRMD